MSAIALSHMSVIPHNSNTLTIAKESLAMSEKTGDKNFQRMAIGLMALTGLGTLLHAIHEMYRDLKPKREKAKPELPACSADEHDQIRQHRHEATPDESWVQKARVGDRPGEGERVWADSISRQTQSRQH